MAVVEPLYRHDTSAEAPTLLVGPGDGIVGLSRLAVVPPERPGADTPSAEAWSSE